MNQRKLNRAARTVDRWPDWMKGISVKDTVVAEALSFLDDIDEQYRSQAEYLYDYLDRPSSWQLYVQLKRRLELPSQ
jgi:hypothetical protein